MPVGFLAATLIAAVLVSAIAWLVGRVLMRLSGHFVAVATLGFLVIATFHPAAVLRARAPERDEMYAGLVADLRLAGRLAATA